MHADNRVQVESGVTEGLKRLGLMQEYAEHFANQQMTKMVDDGDAFELSDDEIDMIKAYRAHDARSRPGSVFTWRTSTEQRIVVPEEPSLLVHPRECLTQSGDRVSQGTE